MAMLIEGFGANAQGGTGGTTYSVTSLVWDAGVEGTLPWALAQEGPARYAISILCLSLLLAGPTIVRA